MRTRLIAVAVAMLSLSAVVAYADGPDCNCEKGYYEKWVTAHKKVTKDVQVPTTVKKCFYREEMRDVNRTVLVPREFIVKKPKEVPEEVCVKKCRQVPVKLIDPSTGCSIISYKCEYYDAKVIQNKTIMVDTKVCRMVPEERCVKEPVRVPEMRDVTVMVTKQETVVVPYQKCVRCPCPPPGPNYSVVVPLDPRMPLPQRLEAAPAP